MRSDLSILYTISLTHFNGRGLRNIWVFGDIFSPFGLVR